MLTLVLLALVATQIDVAELESTVRDGQPAHLAAALLAMVAALVVGALRWHVLLRVLSREHRLGSTVSAYFAGALATNLLPSQVGGDVVRTFLVASGRSRAAVATSVVVDRLSLFGCLLILAWAVYGVDPGDVPGSLVATLGAATVAFAVVVTVLVGAVLAAGRLRGRALRLSAETRAAVLELARADVVAQVTLLGFVYQALILVTLALLARGLAVEVSFAVLAVTAPAVLVLAALPISIAGFGVREASFVVLLGEVDVPATDATVLSLAAAATILVASLPGFAVLLRRRHRGVRVGRAEHEQHPRERTTGRLSE